MSAPVLQSNEYGSFRQSGKGPMVVLLHGFGEDSSVWEHQAGELQDFQLLMPDLPGTGKTPSLSETTMETLAEWLYTLTRDVENFVLIGHSMGGYIALAFAEKYADRLLGLGLFHSTAFADTEEKKQTRRKGIDFMKANGGAAFLRTSIPGLFSQHTKKNHPEWVTEQENTAGNFETESLIGYYEAMIRRPDRTSVLAGASLPVLFILGTEDAAVPLQDGLRQAHLPSRSHLYILEKSAHMGMREQPEESNAYLREYLASF